MFVVSDGLGDPGWRCLLSRLSPPLGPLSYRSVRFGLAVAPPALLDFAEQFDLVSSLGRGADRLPGSTGPCGPCLLGGRLRRWAGAPSTPGRHRRLRPSGLGGATPIVPRALAVYAVHGFLPTQVIIFHHPGSRSGFALLCGKGYVSDSPAIRRRIGVECLKRCRSVEYLPSRER